MSLHDCQSARRIIVIVILSIIILSSSVYHDMSWGLVVIGDHYDKYVYFTQKNFADDHCNLCMHDTKVDMNDRCDQAVADLNGHCNQSPADANDHCDQAFPNVNVFSQVTVCILCSVSWYLNGPTSSICDVS